MLGRNYVKAWMVWVDKVNGCYRNLEELLLKLAEFYLCNDFYRILNFGAQPNTFHVAPFGKDECCAWLVSILNIGKGVLSSDENFLLFGANCNETCVPVRRFIKLLIADITQIESTTYTIQCREYSVNIKFQIPNLANDMKMLAFLGGEQRNSAKYYSSFADVSTDMQKDPRGKFGKECMWRALGAFKEDESCG